MTTFQPLTLRARVAMSISLASATLFAVVWVAFTVLRVFSPFNYVRFVTASFVGAFASIATLLVCLYPKWNDGVVSGDRSVLTRLAAWVSITCVLDSLILEPFILRYFFPGLDYDDSLRWQFQLIVGGLLGSAVAISKRSWRWVPFSLAATAFGIFWLVVIFFGE